MHFSQQQKQPEIAYCERLADVFGVPFSIWRSESSGKQAVTPASPSESLPEQLFDELAKLPPGSLRLRTDDNGKVWVAAACIDGNGERTFAVAHAQLHPLKLAQQLAIAMEETARLESENSENRLLLAGYAQKLSNSFEELTFLYRMSRHVEFCSADRRLVDVASDVLPQLRSSIRVRTIGLYQNGTITFLDGYPLRDLPAWNNGLTELLKDRTVTLVRNATDPTSTDDLSFLPRIQSLACAPVGKDGKIYGWLLAVDKDVDTSAFPDPAAIPPDFFEIGSVEASLLESSRVLLGTQAANHDLYHEKEALVVDVIHTLVGVIEAKDIYTCGHSDRVALIGRRLAEELKLSIDQCHDIFLAGLLHDVGKVGVADDVLLKPTKLTPEEYEIIKDHPVRGKRLLQGLKPLKNLIPGVLHHHEAVDGSGYPDGLKGDDIPLMARILAVADAWDAMTSDRPYRPGMAVEVAEQVLFNGAGKQWDARVVDAYRSARADVLAIRQCWEEHLACLLDNGGRTVLLSSPAVLETGTTGTSVPLAVTTDVLASGQVQLVTSLPSSV